MHQDYLLTFHETEVVHILQDENILNHFSININFIILYEHQPELALQLLKEPDKTLESWDQAVIRVQMQLNKRNPKFNLKNNVHCRIYHMPGLPDVCRIFLPTDKDAGKFVQVSATVMSISPVKLLEYQRSYICVKCKYATLATAEYEKKYIIKQPKKCGNPETCLGTNFVQFGDLDRNCCKDFQQIKIQEQIKKLGVGSMPNTMWVTLEDDLVDSCKPGDNVTICGIVKRRWGEFSKGSKIEIDIVLKANNVQVDSHSNAATPVAELQELFSNFWNKYLENPFAGRDLILKSFCPEIYGTYLVKLAIAVVLAGGSQIEDTMFTGVCTRSQAHLLLVGDPGTGKSQLLRFVSKIIPRSVLTTGVGSTAAGLTVAAVMERGEWQLEGGALVMSDGGVCCIDEFNSMKEHDRTSIHEAMEQQTISVAKASIVCKLNTRCSILAACNPKGNLDPSNPLCMNIALPSPLLSRFDLILLLRDTVNKSWDSRIADYILNGKNSYSKLTDSKLWTIDMLQSYFVAIRKLNPKLTENAETILSTYYQMQRKIDNRNKARTTVRLLESLIRISQGHARLMFHSEVEVMDSVYAVVLVDIAMDVSSILNLNINTRSTFPDCPMNDYCDLLENVLNKLDLQNIFQNEITSMRKNKINLSGKYVSRFFSSEQNENRTPDEVSESVSPKHNQYGFAKDNHEQKRKIIVGNASHPIEKIKKAKVLSNEKIDVNVNENCDIIGSKSTMQEQNEENKDRHLESLGNNNIFASTKNSKLTKPSFEDVEHKDLLPTCRSQRLTTNGEIKDSDNKNKICDKKVNEEIGEDKTSNKDNGSQKKLHMNNFVKNDMDMLMLMPDLNDKFDIDLDFDID